MVASLFLAIPASQVIPTLLAVMHLLVPETPMVSLATRPDIDGDPQLNFAESRVCRREPAASPGQHENIVTTLALLT